MKIDKVCIIGIFFSLFLLTGCGSDESEPSTPPGPQPSEVEYPEVSEDQRVSITVPSAIHGLTATSRCYLISKPP